MTKYNVISEIVMADSRYVEAQDVEEAISIAIEQYTKEFNYVNCSVLSVVPEQKHYSNCNSESRPARYICTRCGACACDHCWKENKCHNCGNTEREVEALFQDEPDLETIAKVMDGTI